MAAIMPAMDRSKTVPALDIPAIRDDELRRLGEQLFAEVRQEHAQDEAEISAWKQAKGHWPELLGSQLAKLCKGDDDAGEIGSACGDGGGCGGD